MFCNRLYAIITALNVECLQITALLQETEKLTQVDSIIDAQYLCNRIGQVCMECI